MKIIIVAVLLINVFATGYSQEDKANKKFQSSIATRQENWLQNNFTADETIETQDEPPGEPDWDLPIAGGLYPMLTMLLAYSAYLFYRNQTLKRARRKQPV
ncbi:MAG: hypothetical protein LBG15_01755 [Dysgonamonadaceae bacterium]|jgi:hypothetical protein|nr:hypothetical protein [Dysgonamonadaceae bacterium]